MNTNNVAHYNTEQAADKESNFICDAIINDDFAYFDNIRQLSGYHSVRTNKLIILFCTKGLMHICIDDKIRIINANHILFIRPNSEISDILQSVDAQCKILCLLPEIIQHTLQKLQDMIPPLWIDKPEIKVPANECDDFAYFMSLFGRMHGNGRMYSDEKIRCAAEALLFTAFGYLSPGYDNDHVAFVGEKNIEV